MPASAQVLTLAHLGRVAEARVLADVDFARDEALGFRSALALHLRSLGFAELVGGNPTAAAEHLLAAAAISYDEVGIREPAILRLHPDAVAALVTLGRIDEAQRLTAELDVSTRINGHPWATTMAGRCHGLLLAAAGDLSGAAQLLEQAMVDHRRLPMPFEEGRTRLLFGSVLRRAGHRSDARREFEAAQAIFVRLGTPVHAEQARKELAGVGGRRSLESELTPVEHRVTNLVAAGQTNREVAAALFVSVRTVEGHLGHVYQKLGVRSRTELARWVSDRPATST
jgi:DNA-binding CsgD family transcriptional regulator